MCEFCGGHSKESAGTNTQTQMMTNMMKMMKDDKANMMCGCGCESETDKGENAFSPQMMIMMEIMPNKLEMILPAIPKEARSKFVLRMLSILMDEGCAGMSEKEKRDIVTKACGI